MVLIIIKIALSIAAGIPAGSAVVYVFNHVPGRWFCDYGENPVERGRELAKAKGLTEKDAEKVTRSLVDPAFKRIKENPWRWVFAVGFSCICLRLSLQAAGQTPAGELFPTGGHFHSGGEQLLIMQLTLAGLSVCWVLLLIALADKIYMIIPDQFLLILMPAGAGMLPIHAETMDTDMGSFLRELTGYRLSDGMLAGIYIFAGIAIGLGLMLFVALLGRLISRTDALGMGDVKLYAVLGFAVGAAGIVFVFLLSTLTAGIWAGLDLARGKTGRRDHKPLGPHICGAAIAYVFIILPYIL
ncbi:MAG: A24 family peptidase [Bacillota bacterium]|nr:A24 family peptidase [Bacillota bacterium]